MKDIVSRGVSAAKGNVYPTSGQQAFLEGVRASVEQLIRQGARVASHRRGTPEQVACAYIVEVLRDALRFAALARAEGRPLRIEQPIGWSSRTLVMGEKPAKVIDLENYRRQHG